MIVGVMLVGKNESSDPHLQLHVPNGCNRSDFQVSQSSEDHNFDHYN